ncbi:MAG: beta-ketoacyl synthase [Desulfuromonas sp.]|nr:MAG: beta-ketoacyl synthase [Desulfuromonas sp.]
MTQVTITAATAVTPLGDTPESTWQGLLAGRSAIAPVSRFDCSRYHAGIAAVIPDLAAAQGTSLCTPLLERLLDGFPAVPSDARLLLASTKGPIDLLERSQRAGALPGREVLAEALLDALRQRFELTAKGININAACASSTIALARAGALIASGRAECVLVVCLDLVSEFVLAGFSALKGLSPTPSRPFDRERDGLSLGEGAAALLLMSQERAQHEGRPMLGRLLGWGVANDANHITAPARDGSGLIAAVEQALQTAQLEHDAVAAISAHGTGTVYNDAMELTAFASLFGARPLPLNSIKGAIGHTLGAAGGIEAALALTALREQLLAPTVGLGQAEEGTPQQVSSIAQSFSGDVLLSTNSGFGGINAALLLAAGEDA